MQVDIITTFPGMFTGFLNESMMARALNQGTLRVNVHDLRDFTTDPHRSVDDTPFGGGGGMILMAEPVARAIEGIRGDNDDATIIIPTARGRLFDQTVADTLRTHTHLIIVCGHYTGIDERIFEYFNPMRLCIGDYVLTGGELPAMVIVDAVARRLPGFLGNDDSGADDSFVIDTLGAAHYTRPQEWRGLSVPSVLVSGHHANVKTWRKEQARQTTERFRPDLLDDDELASRSTSERASHTDKKAAFEPRDRLENEEIGHG